MDKVLLVGLGGFLGALLRYGVGGWVARMKGAWAFPVETLVINVAGCFVLGLIVGFSESRGMLSTAARAFVFTGLLGGFTTYSAFGHETYQLLRAGQWQGASVSIVLQLALGIGGVWAGVRLAHVAS